MKKSGFLLGISFLLVLICSLSVIAVDLSVEIVDDTIDPGESAEFLIIIENDDNEVQDFTLYSLSGADGWQVDPKDLGDRVIENLEPGEEREVSVLATPLFDEMDPGVYQLSLDVDGEFDGESDQVSLKVYLGSGPSAGEYLPSISVELEMDEEIDSLEPTSVVLYLENGNSRNLSDLSLRVESDIEPFNVHIPIGLEGFEEKTVEFTVDLDPYTQPKNYVVFFIFESEGETVKIVDSKVEVEMYVPDFVVEVSEEKMFLKKQVEISLLNEGNAENTQQYLYSISFFSSLFVNSDEGYVVRHDGQSYVVWDMALQPGEQIDVSLALNYRVLFYLFVFSLALFLFYWIVRSPILISKKGLVVVGDENGLSEVKVMLEIRNRSKRPYTVVEIMDTVPGIANVERTLQLGTLKPDKVTHSRQGSKIYWSLSELDALEQRIITYKIKAKLNILGQFQLPRAELEYSSVKGKRKKSYSNYFRMDTRLQKR